jgi:hypothetical protein
VATRQTSSSRVTKASNGAALATLENPRNAINDAGTIWGSASNTRQPSNFTSPTKQKGSGWLFESKGHDLESSSSLLAGSAPEFEPFGKENQQMKSRPLRLSGDTLLYDSQFAPSLRSTGPSQLPAPDRTLRNGVGYNSTLPGRTDSVNHISSNYPSKTTLHGLGMDTSSTNCNLSGRASHDTTSPTSTRFARQANGYLERTVGSIDKTSGNFRNSEVNKKPISYSKFQYASADLDRGVYVVQDDVAPEILAGAYEGGNIYDASTYYDQEAGAKQSQHWDQTYTGLDGRSRLEFLVQGHNVPSNGYHSASLTPTSGTESQIESGATSRTSHHDLAMAGQLGGTDDYAAYVSNGVVVPLSMVRSYGMQMSPHAQGYPYYGYPGYGLTHGPLRQLPPVRSALLEEFRLHRTTKRYELRDIFDHVVEFSGDQHGSRFIQTKLENANSDDKEQIFKEIQSNSLQLMTDLFGNYVIQKLFEHGNQSQKRALADSMRGHVAALSVQMYGCRVVQKALEYVLTDQQASIVKELDGPQKHIIKVIKDQNGNHVVQKAIERVPAEHIQFIVEAHRDDVVKLATHTYGCRVIQRILEYCTPAAKRIILDEVLVCLPPLITDAFGNYVVQHVIQKGEPSDRRRVVETILQQLLVYSKHKFASNVVEMCLDHADEDQRSRMVSKLIGVNAETGQTAVLSLLRDQYGNYVIRKSHAFACAPNSCRQRHVHKQECDC